MRCQIDACILLVLVSLELDQPGERDNKHLDKAKKINTMIQQSLIWSLRENNIQVSKFKWTIHKFRFYKKKLTLPLWGSVPSGRRKRRIWGSGLWKIKCSRKLSEKIKLLLMREIIRCCLPMNCIMLPSTTLLNSNTPPFSFC